MTTNNISKKLAAITITALVSGLNAATATAMTPPNVSQEKSQEPLLLSKMNDQDATVFSQEMLGLNIKVNKTTEPTSLISGKFELNGTEFDGVNYNFK